MKYCPPHPIIDEETTILAAFWQRAFAILIDFIAIIILFIAIIKVMELLGLHLTRVNINGIREIEVKADGISETKIKFLELGFASIPTIYFSLVNYFTRGRTLGKWIMRIHVVSIYHQQISFWHCVERALGYAASTLELGLGFLQIFWNPNRMCLHDRIAETIVVQDKKKK